MCALGSYGETLTLEQTIAIARARSVNATAALNELRSAYWDYRTYRANLLPEVIFKGTLPAYNKRYNNYQQADGSYSFVRNDNLELFGEISLSQRIWPTGGTVALTTSLDYLRQLSGQTGNSFMSIPVALTLTQPLFAANDVKWNRRIEPVRYAEARARFISDTEEVAMEAISDFFNGIIARDELADSRQPL
ncbi:MAG: TolC family protein, partial [Muribaculaceae bacterium]|nr:TolC family protein [Muribaculaceae bacterium]